MKDWAENDEWKDYEFEVEKITPDKTGDTPYYTAEHQCIFCSLCNSSIDCSCTDNENVPIRYIGYYKGKEINF